MANSYYDIECRNEELGLYTVRKKSEDKTYYLTKREDGSWLHTCKAIEVRGEDFMCRHKKMILQKFFINKDFKHRMNISPKRGKSEGA